MAKWKIAERKFKDLFDQILFNRGVISDKEEFLSPDFRKLHDPFLIKNLKKAVLRIEKAKKSNEIIGIFADYDADGIPGAALLNKTFTKLGLKSYVYIPSREGGYGLSKEGIDYLVNKKCSLIVTVDLGIRNFSEAKYCKEIGVYLIITDHHIPDDKIPDADIVVNPKIKGDSYPDRDLAGGGVAYKLMQGLSKIFPKELSEAFLKWNIDLAAISTISDVVPLTGENRVIANYGLKVLRKTKNIGLNELYKVAKIDPNKIMAYSVGFQIAPRINAPGRMDHATKSFELLVTEDVKEAKSLALWLDEKNQERQGAMEMAEREATQKIIKNNLINHKIIVVSGDWQKGVIGPTASHLVEKFSRPVILLSKGKHEFSGSARSLPEIDILKIVEKSEKYLEKFGGHKGACGLTVLENKFDKFLDSIIKNADKEIKEDQLQKTIKIDALANLKDLNIKLYDNLGKLEPYGMGNPKPVFETNNIEVTGKKIVGAGEKHLAINFKQEEKEIKAIFFSGNLHDEKLELHKKYDLIYTLDLDTWQGNNQLKLNIIDIKTSTNETK